MQNEVWQETLTEQKVTYSLEVDGRFVLIENVPEGRAGQTPDCTRR